MPLAVHCYLKTTISCKGLYSLECQSWLNSVYAIRCHKNYIYCQNINVFQILFISELVLTDWDVRPAAINESRKSAFAKLSAS